MLEQTLGVSSPQQNKKKRSYRHISTDTTFSRYTPHSPGFSPLDFYVWRHFKTLGYSSPI